MRVLYVEDDKILGKATEAGLRLKYAVDWVLNAEDADALVATHDYDLLVIDINLPGMSGLQLLKQIRARSVVTPVLLLTARDAVSSRVEGLDSGADDYLVKPFDLDELLARAGALIRRAAGHSGAAVCIGDVELSITGRSVQKAGHIVNLSAREFSILEVLMLNAGKIISRAQIEEGIYDLNRSMEIESNAVEVHISALRRKLGKEFIETIRGLGYRVAA